MHFFEETRVLQPMKGFTYLLPQVMAVVVMVVVAAAAAAAVEEEEVEE